RPILSDRVSIPLQRKLLVAVTAATRLPFLSQGVKRSAIALNGVPAQKLTPRVVADEGASILFLHGGAYCVGSPTTHRNLSSHLATAAQCVVYSLDYRMGPECPFPAAVDDAEAAWQALLADGLAPQKIAIAGDSAGGGLALATTLRLRDQGQPLPGALFLISPSTDMTQSGETISSKQAVDPLISVGWIRQCTQAYAGGEDLKQPLLSPLFAECAGLPPIRIDVGSDEILLSDAQRFTARAQGAGVEVDLHVHEGLWHDFQLFAGMMSAATRTLNESGAWLRNKLAG
ncbi:MAG: alpha/beta hydrolase, partial [Sinobacteraceae bacterium]|nr:alpha/beta hydrolase [Nevskiaceae bacterium]